MVSFELINLTPQSQWIMSRAGVAEGYTVLCSPHRQSWVWAPAQTSTNACSHICNYIDRKGSAAILTSIQSVGVTPEVTLRITQARKHTKRDPPWLWNPGQMSPEIQNRGISGPTKRTYVLKKNSFFFKKVSGSCTFQLQDQYSASVSKPEPRSPVN